MSSRDQISAIGLRDTRGMQIAAAEHKRTQEEHHRGNHEICDDDVFESHVSGYASSTIQIMHIRTMIPNQAKNISSPHGRADSASDSACTSTDSCARRPGDEETTSAAEASSSQNRAATNRHRGDNSQHQLHGCFPREEDYRSQPLTVGESRRARRHALNALPRNWKAGERRQNIYARICASGAGSGERCKRDRYRFWGFGAVERNRTSTGYAHSALNAARLPIPPRPHGNFPRRLPRDMAVSPPRCKSASRGRGALANMARTCKARLKALGWALSSLEVALDQIRCP